MNSSEYRIPFLDMFNTHLSYLYCTVLNSLCPQLYTNTTSISYLAVVNQLLKTPAWEEQTEDIVDLFIYSYAQLLLDRNIISEEYPIYTLQDIIDLGILSEESTQNLGIKIKKYLETHDKNQSIHFLKSYYNLINSNEIVTVNDIIRLMEK